MSAAQELDLAWRLVLALALSSVIGAERELRQKSAGLRTNALVGTGAALFMLVSRYGFAALTSPHVTLDPSRVAAQIVTGIGFIGGGLIFVQRDGVRGLTTAAGIWVTAAVGAACGGDLPILATITTLLYLLVSYGYRWLDAQMAANQSTAGLFSSGAPGAPGSAVSLTCTGRPGLSNALLQRCRSANLPLRGILLHDSPGEQEAVTIRFRPSAHSVGELIGELSSVEGLAEVIEDEPAGHAERPSDRSAMPRADPGARD
ncbi:MAG: MgtC/SapB family protein [Solirubrobacteraceae bacterium]